MSEAFRVTFVCLGNICRSPMAEQVLRRQLAVAGLGDRVQVASAGTGGWHVGEGADRRAVAALARRGYPGRHTAQQFGRADFAATDLVVALDPSNAADLRRLAPDDAARAKIRLLREFDPAHGGDLEVPDPYDGSSREFDHALELIERACAGLVEHLRAEVAP